jgi:PilZ domain
MLIGNEILQNDIFPMRSLFMSLSENDGSNNDQRETERFKSSIPVLVQKKKREGICECTLIDISLNGFAVRLENGKFNLNVGEEFFLIIDPQLFDIDEVNKIQIKSICKRIDQSKFVLGAIYSENIDTVTENIKLIVNCFKKINENDY